MASRSALNLKAISELPVLPALGPNLSYGVEIVSPGVARYTGQIVPFKPSNRLGFWEGIPSDPAFQQFLGVGALLAGASAPVVAPALPALATKFVTPVLKQAINLLPKRSTSMWPFDGESSIGDVFNRGLAPSNSFDFGGALNTGVQILGGLFGGNRSQSVPMQIQTSAAAGVPMVRGAMAVGSAVARRFPQLAARLQSLQMTKSAAFSMMRRLGPASLIGMGFAAVEVAQLASSGSSRRRMNMCNGRALRRASRRLEAFHKFYKRTCGTPSVRRGRKKC